MKTPISHRRGIPFFYQKTEVEFQQDPYERYADMVMRQSALHLADDYWGSYPMQAVFDFAEAHYPTENLQHILEIGCGVGRWIGNLAQRHPTASCWGIDYSYQMLRQARDFWVQGEEISIELASRGFPNLKTQGHQLSNLQLGLAKAANLPFEDNSQDLVLNSFLLDRTDNPTNALIEMRRVLKPNGKLLVLTPLNFGQAIHWKTYYPPVKIVHILTQMGFRILEWQEDLLIHEPLDAHGNVVRWKCLGFVAVKVV